ncbi:MAG: Xaa-Pro peptidase family protein [Syntrophaceticus sp.]|jgi:Xaa-Pro aminopeptidase|nr:Xaa-Pro peptidase family protein [Syntrophaceticus sp.]HBG22355.1 Xaa-Pro dipeptidase [Peptococcaceae bacterium]
MTAIYKKRLSTLRHDLEQQHLESLLVSKSDNVFYLSGFSGGEGLLLVTQQASFLFADGRYQEQAQQEAPGCKFILYKKSFVKALTELARTEGIQSICFEQDHLTYWQWERLRESFSAELVPVKGLVEKLRLLKDETEIELIREAGAITASAFRYLLGEIRPGQSEQEIAIILEYFMRSNGSGPPAFETIVASGERGALPHGTATEKKIRRGELITFDLGATYKGYAADLTRTIAVGTVSARQQEVYEIVREAQARGIRAVRAGVKAAEVDSHVRRFFAEAGYDDYFVHSLGHGVGLAVHEGPRLAQGEDLLLEKGMVVTIEPGVYIPRWGGVRIEDTVLVKENGCEILTPVTKYLIVA